MFEGRSVDYNDETLAKAVADVATFNANFGGTEIYRPLAELFRLPRP